MVVYIGVLKTERLSPSDMEQILILLSCEKSCSSQSPEIDQLLNCVSGLNQSFAPFIGGLPLNLPSLSCPRCLQQVRVYFLISSSCFIYDVAINPRLLYKTVVCLARLTLFRAN